jgi:mannose/fructose/N-acetylgalactosamine-specific phosphotransferase system component IIC
MGTLEKWVVFFLAGGIVGLDTTAAWQILLAHPLISSTLLGWLFGNLPLGLFYGVLMELIWLKDVPVGGAKFPEGNLGSLVGLGTILLIDPVRAMDHPWLLLWGILYAILIAQFIGFTIVLMRRNNEILVRWADVFAEKGSAIGVSWMHRLGVLHAFFHGAAWTVLAIDIGFLVLPVLTHLGESWFHLSLSSVEFSFLGLGMGAVGFLVISQKNWLFLAMGILLGIILAIVAG